MSFLDNLENNLKALESLGPGGLETATARCGAGARDRRRALGGTA